MSLPSTSGAQRGAVVTPSPRRSHGALTEAGDFHASLRPRAMKVRIKVRPWAMRTEQRMGRWEGR
jgi:hypothetical protein